MLLTILSNKTLHCTNEIGDAASDLNSKGIRCVTNSLTIPPHTVNNLFLLQGVDSGGKCTKTTNLSIELFS